MDRTQPTLRAEQCATYRLSIYRLSVDELSRGCLFDVFGGFQIMEVDESETTRKPGDSVKQKKL